MTSLVAYYRVSTSKQERSGLGLLAQKQIIENYAQNNKAEIVHEIIETESGKYFNNREGLTNAIKYCIDNGFTLIVAKLDRLSRDVEHTFKIQKKLGESKLICCDLPSTDSLTLSIFAGLAQREREIISLRTRQALAELKKKGVVLGKPENLTDEGRERAWEVTREKARSNKNNRRAIPLIAEYRNKGFSYRMICERLNDNGFVTSQGKEFKPMSVKRLYERV